MKKKTRKRRTSTRMTHYGNSSFQLMTLHLSFLSISFHSRSLRLITMFSLFFCSRSFSFVFGVASFSPGPFLLFLFHSNCRSSRTKSDTKKNVISYIKWVCYICMLYTRHYTNKVFCCVFECILSYREQANSSRIFVRKNGNASWNIS